MPFRFNRREQLALFWTVLKWCTLGAWVGILSGGASALFLHSLNWATGYREIRPWLLFLLPVAGLAIALMYHRYGKAVEGGNNLLLDRVHNPDDTIPFRMAPLILIGTVVTHLFGGSAGREGTAVQMGGTLANLAQGPLRLSPRDHRILIMSGISGGFGSVFGTPLAGTVFGLEVLTVGRMSYEGLIPCFVASFVGDIVCRALGITHHAYHVGVPLPSLTPLVWALIAVAGALFGGASVLFAELTHAVHRGAGRFVPKAWLRPVVGGLLIIALTYAVGTRAYLGLSLPLIEESFTPRGVVLWAFALKILFTAVTLGTGFKGGEVTPLFCIGATLGAAFARVTGQPTGFFAALGFVAVFAGAANTPLSCIVMGIELFGAPMAVPLGAACILSYILSGHRGIYLSQRVETPKSHSVFIPNGSVLRDAREGAMEVNFSHYPFPPGRDEALFRGDDFMANDTEFSAVPHGMIRIFMRAGDRGKPRRLRDRLFGRPVHQEIIKAARDFGLPQGMVKQSISGFLDERRIHHAHPEYDNGSLPIYVELHGTREELERFCQSAKTLLRGRKIVYKDVEHWGWDEDRPDVEISVPVDGE